MGTMLNVTAAETLAKQNELALEESHLSSLKWNNPQPGLDHDRVVADAERAIQPLRDEVAAMQDAVGGKVFLIPEQNIETLIERLEKLNKRARKLNVAIVEFTQWDSIERKVTRNNVTTYEVAQYVAVKGASPKLAGWTFAATLEHDENGVIVRRLPGLDASVDLIAYREADPSNCDQCHTSRRRNDTYVVLHEDGTLKQVGSTCLADFLGGQSPERIAAWLTFVADFMDDLDNEESEFYGGSAPSRIPLVEYLTHVACMIRENGWVSKGMAYDYGGFATADAADSNMFNMAHRKTDRQGAPLWTTPTDADEATALAAIEHVRALKEDDLLNDYVYNLFTSLKGESIPSRQRGIAASAITFHSKAVQKQVEREAKAVSEFVGEVKGKLTIDVTVSRIHWIEDRYSFNGGSKPLYVMIDADGNQIKWFSSREIDGMEQGATGTISGTVKAHDDNATYGKSTVLTRCKFVAAS
jgi:hypothetical protein